MAKAERAADLEAEALLRGVGLARHALDPDARADAQAAVAWLQASPAPQARRVLDCLAAGAPGEAVRALDAWTRQREDGQDEVAEAAAGLGLVVDPGLSLAALQRLAQLRPSDPAVWARLGLVRLSAGDRDGAARALSEVLSLPSPDAGRWRAVALANLGRLAAAAGSVADAERLLIEALGLARASEDRAQTAGVLAQLGRLAALRGDLVGAVEAHAEALSMFAELERPAEIAQCLSDLAKWSEAAGLGPASLDLRRRALQTARSIGDLPLCADQLHAIGRHLHACDDLPGAASAYREALELARMTGDRAAKTALLAALGVVAEERGETADARRYWRAARDLARDLGETTQAAQLDAWLGDLAGG